MRVSSFSSANLGTSIDAALKSMWGLFGAPRYDLRADVSGDPIDHRRGALPRISQPANDPVFDHAGEDRELQASSSDLTTARITFDISSDLRDIEALTAEWDGLHTANKSNRLAFQGAAWLTTWINTYGPANARRGKQVAIVTVRRHGQLMLVCPFAMVRRLGIKQLVWLGEPASQYGDIVSDGTSTSHTQINAAMDYVVEALKPDVIYLRKVRQDSAIHPWLEAADACAIDADAAPFLDFSSATTAESYAKRYSGKARKNRRRLRRRLEEQGPVVTRVLAPGEAAKHAVAMGISFKRQWLATHGELSSALRDDQMADFLTTFATSTNRTTRPFVSVMTCGDVLVSVQFGIVSNQRLALHMIAHNPEMEKFGAGVLHIEDTIAHAIQSGWSELDFLAPRAAYKAAWADGAVPISGYVLSCSKKGHLVLRTGIWQSRCLIKAAASALPLRIRQILAAALNRL